MCCGILKAFGGLGAIVALILVVIALLKQLIALIGFLLAAVKIAIIGGGPGGLYFAALMVAAGDADGTVGGATYGVQTYVNQSNTAIDTVTLRPVKLGPVPDNQSTGNPNRDTEYGKAHGYQPAIGDWLD